ncbi:MAG: hypothetical protein REI78_09715 [Pedobacter sp.]|nr:hypothetical protein [Pedobacter sp.]MDQ8053292.1 hypothetical protein [Pedobacter sp.]
MKFLALPLIFLLYLFSTDAHATYYACNTGNYLYPNATGGLNSSGDPTYYNSNPITIRWWDQDPNCGILNSKIKARSSGDDNCQVVGGAWGVIYSYNPSDNSCVPLPIDDYIPIVVILTALLGAYLIRRHVSFNENFNG